MNPRELFNRLFGEPKWEVVGSVPKELGMSLYNLALENERRQDQVKHWERIQAAERAMGCGSDERAQEIAEEVDAEGTEIWATEHKPFLEDLHDTAWDAVYDHLGLTEEERTQKYKLNIPTLEILRRVEEVDNEDQDEEAADAFEFDPNGDED